MRDKIKSFIKILENRDQIKLAAKLEKALTPIEDFVKTIGVPKNDPKVLKIKEIKQKPQLYGKDEAMIKLLWLQAKREALHRKMAEANILTPVTEKKDDFLNQVLEYLNKEVTKAIQDFKSYPQEKEASLSDEEISRAVSLSYTMAKNFRYSGLEIRKLYCSNSRFLSVSQEFFDIWAELGAWEDNDNLPLDLEYLKLITKKLQELRDLQKPMIEQMQKKLSYLQKAVDLANVFLKALEDNDTSNIEPILNTTSVSGSIYFKLRKFIDEKTLDHLRHIKNSPAMTLWLTCKEPNCRALAEKVSQE